MLVLPATWSADCDDVSMVEEALKEGGGGWGVVA